MKIFIAGDGHSDLHELAMYKAFKKLEHKVFFFGWNKHFRSNNPAINLFRRIQFKFILGPQINHINNMFIEALASIVGFSLIRLNSGESILSSVLPRSLSSIFKSGISVSMYLRFDNS